MTSTATPTYLAAELRRAGVARFSVKHGRKHPKLLFEHAGRMRMMVFSATPSDRRSERNQVSLLRRMLRGVA